MNKIDSIPSQITLNSSHISMVILTIIFTVLGYFAFTFWGGWSEVTQAIATVGFQGIVASLALSLVNFGLRFIRWHYYLGLLGHKIPGLHSLWIYISGYALTTTPGKAGEAVRSIFLKEYGMSYRKSLAAFFSERTSDLIASVLLSTLGIILYREGMYLVACVGLLLIGGIYVIHHERWLRGLENFARRKLPTRFSDTIEFFLEMILAFRNCYTWKSFSYGLGLGLVAWAAEGVAFYYILQLLHADISLISAIFIYNFALLIGSVSFLPGGLGGAEIAMWQLLLAYGVPNSSTIAATIIIRLTTLWFSVAIGLACLSICTLKREKIKT